MIKHLFTQKHTPLALACALALGLISGTALSQSETELKGYVVNLDGEVWRNSYGECWRSNSVPSPESIAQCEPEMVSPSTTAVKPPTVVAQVTPTPAPAPAPAPAPVAMSLSATPLFAFDSALLRPEGRTKLDRIAREINDMKAESIMITGHTDHLGSASYNQNLSEQRAETVKTYLVGRGIDASRMQATGRGHMQPVVRASECMNLKDAPLIQCLQPNRRVEVQVSGTGTPR